MLSDLRLFGTASHPLRASGLPSLVRCPWRSVLLEVGSVIDESGIAADTGSVVHAAAAAWHGGEGVEAIIARLRDFQAVHPLADLDDARLHFTPYTRDPRNKVPLVLCEEKILVTLSPSEDDPTGSPIVIRGTLDQVRRGDDGRLRVYDIKTGDRSVWEILHEYTMQLAAYTVGAEARLGEPVHPGGFIRTRGYRKRGVDPTTSPDGVFVEVPWGREDIDAILDAVRYAVAGVRAGRLWVGPGAHCSFCPAGGLEGCLPKLRSLPTV